VVGWIAASPQFPTLYHAAWSSAGIFAGALGGYLGTRRGLTALVQMTR
jgi:hypothetical protein